MVSIARSSISALLISAGCINRTIHFVRGNTLTDTDTTTVERRLYNSQLCKSVIAISGFPDFRYLQENNKTYDHGEEFVCELGSGQFSPITGSIEQMKQMQSLLDDGKLVSGETSVGVAYDIFTEAGDNSIHLPRGDIILVAPSEERRKKKRGRLHKVSEASEGDDIINQQDDRYLQTLDGTRQLLVVRVTDSRGRVHSDNASTISDNVFGTNGDTITLKSRIAACSFNKLRLTNTYDVDISQHLEAPGVIDIKIGKSLNNDRATVREAVILATEQKLGLKLSETFDHVMFVVEGCYTADDCDWAAYGFVNSWFSLFKGDNYKYVAVQMHEFGHNLNLAHSGGLDNKSYSDHSCIMGNPYHADDDGLLCFNAAKIFQIAQGHNSWYKNDHDTEVWDSSTSSSSYWAGTIIGIADYQNNRNARPVVLKIESGTLSDIFIGFNRAKGVNLQTAQYQNQVTVIEAGNDGVGYSQSYVKAALLTGESYTVAKNWRGSGLPLTITVNDINISTSPGYADVLIQLGDVKPPTTRENIMPQTIRPRLMPTTASSPSHPAIQISLPTTSIPTSKKPRTRRPTTAKPIRKMLQITIT